MERLERRAPAVGAMPILLVGIGLAVGTLGTLALQALRAPAPVPDAPSAPATPEPVAVRPPSPTERAGLVPRNERSPEHWHAWAHDEVARAWRVAAREGHTQAQARLVAVARDVEAAAGAPAGARAVVREAQEALVAIAAGDLAPVATPPAPTRPEPRPVAVAPRPPREPAPAPAPAPARQPVDDGHDDDEAWSPPATSDAPPAARDDDDDERRPVGVAPRAAVATAARPLLLRLYDCYHKKDMAGVLALLKQLEEHGEVPEVFAARGLLHFHAREYRPALDALTRAGDVTLQAVHDRAFAALYLGRLDIVRELLDHEALKDETRLRLIVEGPFRKRYERAADVLEGRSDDGHYRVITDLGISRAELAQLEQRLGAEADAGKRLEQVERARRRHRGLDELGKVMEKAYKAYDKLFGPDRPGEVVPTVIVFSDRGQFETFSARLRVGSTENTLGYYWPPYRILVFYDQDEGQRRGGGLVSKSTLETLLHETFHQWLDLYVEDAPRWFDEGLAEYFGMSELGRTELRYGLVPQAPPSRLHDIKLAFAGEYPRPLPLQRLLTADHATFMRGAQAGINYAHAWSFVHYLGSSTGGQKLLREYFKALREGLDREKAFDRVFAPLDLDRMEADWRQYVGRLR